MDNVEIDYRIKVEQNKQILDSERLKLKLAQFQQIILIDEIRKSFNQANSTEKESDINKEETS